MKTEFIEGYDDTNMEFEDDIHRKEQEQEVQNVMQTIHDPEDVNLNMPTLPQRAKMDYQKFVEDEFQKMQNSTAA